MAGGKRYKNGGGFKTSFRSFLVSLILAGLVAGVVGAAITNYALITVSAVLMSIPLIIKLINDMIIGEVIIACFDGLGLAAIIFLYIWSPLLASSTAASVLDRPVLWVVVGAGVIQLPLFYFVFRVE